MERKIVNEFTRKIEKEYNRILFVNANVITDEKWKANFRVNPNDIQDAKDYLVWSLFWLTETEVENLKANEFEALIKQADKFIETEKNGSKSGWNPVKI